MKRACVTWLRIDAAVYKSRASLETVMHFNRHHVLRSMKSEWMLNQDFKFQCLETGVTHTFKS